MSEDSKYNSCNICCSDKSVFVTCNYCKFQACDDCQEKFLLTQNNPKCMDCKKEWSIEFLHYNFSKNFINKKYKQHRENILFEMEKALLPRTQIELTRKRKIKELSDEVETYKQMIYNLEIEINYLRNNRDVIEEKKLETTEQLRNCPKVDCRGYLNSINKDTSQCGLCEVRACKKCLEIKEDNHECDEKTLDTLKSIKNECRACPKCSALISKISGCDMMFCTMCKTGFSWKTGELATGPIHNPHYFEYLASIGEDSKEVMRRFGGDAYVRWEDITNENIYCIRFDFLVSMFTQKIKKVVPIATELYELARFIIHIEDVEKDHRYRPVDLEEKNQDIREQYLTKQIDDKKFRSHIYRRNKKHEFNIEVYMLLDMLVTITKEEYCKLVLHIKKLISSKDKRFYLIQNNEEYLQFLAKIENLVKYTEESLIKIYNRFDYKYNEHNFMDELKKNVENLKKK